MVDEVEDKVVKILEDESLGESDKIKKLHALGFSNSGIIELGFKPATVYKALPVHPKGKVGETQDNGYLPSVLKTGTGQTITPEGIMRTYLLQDGKDGELMLKGMMLYRAAQLAVLTDVEIMKGQVDAQGKMLKPILDVMIETRKEQDAAAERARGSSHEIAQEAAVSTARAMMGYIDEKIPKGPPPKNMSEMVTKRIDSMFDMMFHMSQQRMFPGYEQGGPEGWETEYIAPPQPEAVSEPSRPAGSPEGWETEEENGGEQE